MAKVEQHYVLFPGGQLAIGAGTAVVFARHLQS